MTGWLRRLAPRSLAGQIIALVAVALFVAQAVNFALLLRERRNQLLNATTAPAVVRILDALDGRGLDGPGAGVPEHGGERERGPARRGPRVLFLDAAPALKGTRRPDVEARAASLLDDTSLSVRSILAFEQMVERPERRRLSLGPGRGEDRAPRMRRELTLAVEYEPGRWASVQTRGWGRVPAFGGWLVGQTIILYLFVLAPLWLIGRRLARPLRDLTASADRFARTGAAEPVAERGPGDVRHLTLAFNAMRRRLVAMLDEKDRMLGAIGHDLRTPLASLRVRAEAVEDEGERARMSETIDEMSRMLDDILALARSGRSAEPAQKTDIAALADAVVEDFIDLGQPVLLAESPRLVAEVRPQQLRRALRNLIENAVAYGGRADVSLSAEPGFVTLTVADEGPGLPEERMAEMLEPFTRLEGSRSRETGGAGLGLALVRAIMDEHDGQLRLANRPAGGLSASLVLPA